MSPKDEPTLFEDDDEYLEPGEEESSSEHQEMDALMDQYLSSMTQAAQAGQHLKVPILAIQSDSVLVDVGSKAEGIVPKQDFHAEGGEFPYKVGDEIDVVVKGQDAETGLIILSHAEARRHAAVREVEEALASGKVLTGRVVRAVKGGLIVDIGTTAFLPASQIDLRRVENFEGWVGRDIECVVLEYAPSKRRIIVSRRKLLEDQRAAKRDALLSRLEVGQTLQARVKRLVDFGAFVDLGGVDGLIPRAEISWQRTAKPEDYLKVDDAIQVMVMQIETETGKITLSRRRLTPDPWETACERFLVGRQVEGSIVALTNYGAFVRIEEGLDGMIHIKDIAWDSDGKKPSDYLTVGQQVSATVLDINPETKRIALGLKQQTEDPWRDVPGRYPEGSRIKGVVTGLNKYGAFVELEPGIKGMVHVSDFSWEKRINQPRDVVSKGQEIEACVLSVDAEKRRISLGVKQLQESPVRAFSQQHKVGDPVEGEVIEVTEFGVYLKLDEALRGFIHVSQLDRSRVESPASVFKVGDQVKAEILKINPDSNEVKLSRRHLLKREEKRDTKAYMKSSEPGGHRLGELLAELSLEDDLPAE
jgi:small subunit ribosomal protein S1